MGVVHFGLGTFGFLYGAFYGNLSTPFFTAEAAFTSPDAVLPLYEVSVLAVAQLTL